MNKKEIEFLLKKESKKLSIPEMQEFKLNYESSLDFDVINSEKKIKKSKLKFRLIFSFAAVVILGVGTFGVLNLLPSDAKYQIKSNYNNLTMDLSGAKALAMVPESKINKSVSLQPLNGLVKGDKESDSKDERFVIGKVTADNIFEQVNIFNGQNIVGTSDVEVYQLKVYSEFTFVSFISSRIRKESKLYCRNNYTNQFNVCFYSLKIKGGETGIYDRNYPIDHDIDSEFYDSPYVKSYIIHNESGKIYDLLSSFSGWKWKNISLSDFDKTGVIYLSLSNPKSTSIEYGGGRYILRIQNDNLALVNFAGENSNAIPVFKDKYGTLFVLNPDIDLIDNEKNIIYYTNNKKYLFGKDGITYITSDSKISGIFKKVVNREEVTASSLDIEKGYFDFRYSWFSSIEYYFKDSFSYTYTFNDTNLYNYNFEYRELKLIYDRDLDKNISFLFEDTHIEKVMVVGDLEYFLVEEGNSLYYYEFDKDNYPIIKNNYGNNQYYFPLKNKTLLDSNIKKNTNRMAYLENNIIKDGYGWVKPLSLTGREYYRVLLGNSGLPELKLIESDIREIGNDIYIQPLN